MVDVLRCQDRWGRSVVLTDRCWLDHVVRRRPYMLGHEEACVVETLVDPAAVTHDVDYSNRECFYRQSPLPAPYGGVFVKVVVAYESSRTCALPTGPVVTVHLTAAPKSGEKRIWP